jgi:hypothetical protein
MSCFTSYGLLALALCVGSLTAGEIGPPARVSVIRTPNGGTPAEARLGPDGTIHVIYTSPSDLIPYYVKSSDHGSTFSAPVPVVEQSARKPGLEFAATAMAVGQGGTVYAAMMTNNWKVKLPGVPEGLVFATLRPGANAFTPVRSLNGRPSEGFSLAADDHGNVTATWLADKLFINTSRNGGATFSSNAELNPAYDPCNCCTTRAVYGADGSLAVLYREETNNERDMYMVVVKKNGRQIRTRISSTLWKINACPMTYYSLSATADGYTAAWPTKGEIYFARLDRDGRVMPPGEIKTPGRTGMRTGLVALGAGDGETLVAWKEQDQLRWEIYGRDGHPEGSPSSAPSAGKGTSGVVDGNRFILFQ